MRRLAVFAGYNNRSILEPYVIHYLKELHKIADIVVVYDNELNKKEILKIENLTLHCIGTEHRKYDFGSYEIGIKWALGKHIYEKYDSLILCNDSMMGPFRPFDGYFNEMEHKDNNDFWGFFKYIHTDKNAAGLNVNNIEHIQSYFIVIKKNVKDDPRFLAFFNRIEPQESNVDVIRKYEVGLSQYLMNLGYKSRGYFSGEQDFVFIFDHFIPKIKDGFPFIKKKSIYITKDNSKHYLWYHSFLKEIIFPYDIQLIDDYLINNKCLCIRHHILLIIHSVFKGKKFE